jgi:hypothetical protein
MVMPRLCHQGNRFVGNHVSIGSPGAEGFSQKQRGRPLTAQPRSANRYAPVAERPSTAAPRSTNFASPTRDSKSVGKAGKKHADGEAASVAKYDKLIRWVMAHIQPFELRPGSTTAAALSKAVRSHVLAFVQNDAGNGGLQGACRHG